MGMLRNNSCQDGEMPSGWPLGLEIMCTRLRVTEGLQAAVEEPQHLHVCSASCSSFSSSNLDTESTASFFQDRSISLGHLIGIRPTNRRGFYYPNANKKPERICTKVIDLDVSRVQEVKMSHRLCIPLLLSIKVKVNPNKSNSKGD